MNIVTACDTGFFFCLKELAKSVRKCYDKPVIVYDLGLTEQEKQQLDAVIIPIELNDKVEYQGPAHIFPGGGSCSRNTHKPFCVRDYFERYDEPMILVDADCLFREKVELDGFDVAITLDPRKISRTDMYNGMIYSGVVFFNCAAEELVNRWEQECMTENTTDQKALADVLGEQLKWKDYKKIQQWNNLKIKMLDTGIYNDFHLKRGKIWHFATTKHRDGVFEKLIEAYEQGRNVRKTFLRVARGKKGLFEKMGDFLGLNNN